MFTQARPRPLHSQTITKTLTASKKKQRVLPQFVIVRKPLLRPWYCIPQGVFCSANNTRGSMVNSHTQQYIPQKYQFLYFTPIGYNIYTFFFIPFTPHIYSIYPFYPVSTLINGLFTQLFNFEVSIFYYHYFWQKTLSKYLTYVCQKQLAFFICLTSSYSSQSEVEF